MNYLAPTFPRVGDEPIDFDAVTDIRYEKSAVFLGQPDQQHHRGYRTDADRSRGARMLARMGCRVLCYSDTQARFAAMVTPGSDAPGVSW